MTRRLNGIKFDQTYFHNKSLISANIEPTDCIDNTLELILITKQEN